MDILGTPFYVDVQREELWQKGRRENVIPFSVFDRDGDGYTFLYDLEKAGIPEDRSEIKELGDRYMWVTLPALMELDPEGIALKYHIPLEVLCPEKAQQFNDDDDEEYFHEEELFG